LKLHEESVLHKRIAIVFGLLMMTAAGFAQVPTSGNVFLGYSFNRADTGLSDRVNLNGWEGSVEGKVVPHVGIVADFGGQYGKLTIPSQGVDERDRIQSYLFGPRVSFSVGKIRPFAHVLIGAAQFHATAGGFSNSETDFADAIGGGIDYHLIPRVSWRVQADALQTHFFGERQNDGRFSTGLVVKF
jgi:hypothetical protein